MSLDDYARSKVIGKGSYGEVWLVKHKRDKKQYVLKKMSLQNASKRERKAAEQEAKLLAKLKHPNIVSYKDSFETDDGFLYIAMGFCEGGDLYNRLKEQKNVPLEETQVVEWFVQIAMALQYMHERNILHRDLKTQNIFLTKSKIIKVGDLGIARVLDNSSDMATTLIGTPYYMSPELFSNKPYNHKSDVWALGCCVYEMATLRHAFNAKDMNSLVYKILRGKMPMMPRQYSADLVNLIKAMLNANPDRRPNVNRILRDPYIKKNIALFLEGTRKKVNNSKRPQSTSDDGQSSARSSVSSVSSVGNVVKVYSHSKVSASSSGDNKALEPLHVGPNLDPIQEEKTPRSSEGSNSDLKKISNQKPVSATPKRPFVSPSYDRSKPEKSKDSLAPDLPPSGRGSSPNRQLVNRNNRRNRRPRSNKSIEVEVEVVDPVRDRRSSSSSASSASSSSSIPGKSVFRNPKKVDQPRPLPPGPAPSSGEDALPVSSRSRRGGAGSDSGYKSHESSAHSQDPTEPDTPRVGDQQHSVNKSARARRREKVELETPRTARSVDIERPLSARASSDHAHKRRMELEAGGDRPSRPNSARSTPGDRRHELEAGGDKPSRPSSASSARSAPTAVGLEKPEYKSQPSVTDESSDEAEELQEKDEKRRPIKRNPTVRMQCPPEQKLASNRQQDVTDNNRDFSRDQQERPAVRRYKPVQLNPRPGWPIRRDPRSGVLIPDYQSDPFRKDNARTSINNGQAHSLYHVDILRINSRPKTDSMIVSVGDSDEEEMEVDEAENSGQNKEINNFITLLDHTLNLKKDDKSDEDSEGRRLDEIEEEDEESQHSKKPRTGGSITYAVKNPKVIKTGEEVDMPDFDPRPRHQNPGKALGSSTRLMDRIGALRKDCIRGLGVVKLKQAYDILDNIEGDELENALVELLGREEFEIYAGKIWQLKFCEEAAFGISS